MDPEIIRQIINIVVVTIIILVIFYFVQSSKKKQEEMVKKMQDDLKKGNKVVTYSGLCGIIDEILEDRVILITNPDKVKLSIEKWAVAGLDDRSIYDK